MKTRPAAPPEALAAAIKDVRLGTTTSGFRTLQELDRAPNQVRVSDLAERVGIHQSSQSALLAEFGLAGLVTLERRGRERYYGLTPRGQMILQAVTALAR